jgi:hypothetical protein
LRARRNPDANAFSVGFTVNDNSPITVDDSRRWHAYPLTECECDCECECIGHAWWDGYTRCERYTWDFSPRPSGQLVDAHVRADGR